MHRGQRKESAFVIKIFKYIKPKEWLMVLASLIFIVTQVWMDLKLPDYLAEITKLVQTPGSAGMHNVHRQSLPPGFFRCGYS